MTPAGGLQWFVFTTSGLPDGMPRYAVQHTTAQRVAYTDWLAAQSVDELERRLLEHRRKAAWAERHVLADVHADEHARADVVRTVLAYVRGLYAGLSQ